jgi:tetratricopeptide (TPR) repeat protein
MLREPLSSRKDDLRVRQPDEGRGVSELGRDVWCRLSTYELDLRARYLVGQRNVTAVREAAAQVEDILQRHPSYAPAYVTLAECYRMLTALELLPPSEVVPKMRTACRHALQLDAHSPDAHAAFAGVLAWEWNFAAAEDEYKLAVQSGPRDAQTYQRYAVHLAAFGRFAEALDCADRACDLAPLAPACEHARGVVHYWMRDYGRALECANRVVAIAPHFGMGHHLLGFVCLHLHEYEKAVTALERATILSGASTFDRGYQAFGLGRAGEQAKARQILAGLVAAAQGEYVAPLSIAHCHLGLGELDAALTCIERAYAPGDCQWPYFLAAPVYEPLFRFERFQRVLERIGLPLPQVAT